MRIKEEDDDMMVRTRRWKLFVVVLLFMVPCAAAADETQEFHIPCFSRTMFKGIKGSYKRFDSDNDGFLNYRELLDLNRQCKKYRELWRISWLGDFDSKRDGVLTEIEIEKINKYLQDEKEKSFPRWIQSLLTYFDSNGNKELEGAEIARFHDTLRPYLPLLRDRVDMTFLSRYDRDNDRVIDDSETGAMLEQLQNKEDRNYKRMMSCFDLNGNGRLDDDEVSALRERLRQRNEEIKTEQFFWSLDRRDKNGNEFLDLSEVMRLKRR